MAKRKLERFRENLSFKNLIQPKLGYPPIGFELKGKWKKDFFQNENPIVLELGCGRGEYTLELGRRNPDKNFIGIDVKGARLWRGAKTALEENLVNIGFLRIMIDQITYYFEKNEISEIWITFPDPQPQQSRERKRLTSPLFLNRYKEILKPGSTIHLKTDNLQLYEYTKELIESLNLQVVHSTNDLYHSQVPDSILDVKTTYEKIFMKKGFTIKYLSFRLS